MRLSLAYLKPGCPVPLQILKFSSWSGLDFTEKTKAHVVEVLYWQLWQLPSKQTDYLEVVTVTISFNKFDVTFCMVCAPPNAMAVCHKDPSDYLTTLASLPNPLFILSNFNLLDISLATLTGSTIISNNFCECNFSVSLDLSFGFPNYMQGNILDLVLTNRPKHITFTVYLQDYQCITSDHYLIIVPIITSVHAANATSIPSQTSTHYKYLLSQLIIVTVLQFVYWAASTGCLQTFGIFAIK